MGFHVGGEVREKTLRLSPGFRLEFMATQHVKSFAANLQLAFESSLTSVWEFGSCVWMRLGLYSLRLWKRFSSPKHQSAIGDDHKVSTVSSGQNLNYSIWFTRPWWSSLGGLSVRSLWPGHRKPLLIPSFTYFLFSPLSSGHKVLSAWNVCPSSHLS